MPRSAPHSPAPAPVAVGRACRPAAVLGHLDIARLFNDVFRGHRVTMVGSHDEPLYLPAQGPRPAEVRYVRDYAASALHEAAHWCTAGAARRRLVDYGYDYTPPPRDRERRIRFYRVELMPQAVECLFAAAAGVRFTPSVDDPAAPVAEIDAFGERIRARVRELRQAGLPPRAARFESALAQARRVPTRHG